MFEDGVVLGMGVGIRATKDAAIVAFTAGGNTALLSGVRRRAYPWAFVSKVSLFIFFGTQNARSVHAAAPCLELVLLLLLDLLVVR